MAVKIKFYQHDLKPDLTVRLERQPDPTVSTWVPVDLTGAVDIRAIGVDASGNVIFDRSVTGDVNGMVTMLWQEGDTAEIGVIKTEFEVMWPGSKPETFRPDAVYNVVADFA